MRKNVIISALGAALITRECPWFAACRTGQQAAVWLGFSIVLLFFCLFCEEKHEKWQKNREWRQDMKSLAERTAWLDYLRMQHRRAG